MPAGFALGSAAYEWALHLVPLLSSAQLVICERALHLVLLLSSAQLVICERALPLALPIGGVARPRTPCN
jgi:hypothetical protein